MPDLNFQNISSVQNNLQPAPVTLVATTTIAPTTYLTFITGVTAIATITPPVTGQHSLVLVMTLTNSVGFVTTGNILVGTVTNNTLWQNRSILMVYNPITAKYHPLYPNGL